MASQLFQELLHRLPVKVSAEYVEGDHTLFIGKVTDIHLEDKEPLLFL